MKIIKNRLTNNLAWLCNYEIWILLEKLIKKTGLGIEFRHQEGFEMLIWRFIYLSKYKIIDKLKMLSTARAIAQHEIFARYRPPCYAFHFDVAFVRFELRLTEKRSIETSHKVCSAFCDREWVGHDICNLCRNGGPRELKKTWLTLKTHDMEVKIDLYGFVTFF